MNFDEVKVFSATKARDRAALGDRVTDFIREFDGDVVNTVVRQSSDHEFHCLSIVLFLRRSHMGRATPQTRMLRG
jgi:hypothetical protein